MKCASLPEKNIIGIPWRVAFALQADSWYLRQDIIWHKPNPMPEAVKDRCTKAHEYIFLLSKSPRYHFDAESIAEAVAVSSVARLRQDIAQQHVSERVPGKTNGTMKAVGGRDGKRNRRSVWTVTTKPFKGAHFATFPPDLIEPCILAGCPIGGTVLDPFGGAGTTGLVAERLGRNSALIELNPEYCQMARDRIDGEKVAPKPVVGPRFSAELLIADNDQADLFGAA
jgi:DNA modification methylase